MPFGVSSMASCSLLKPFHLSVQVEVGYVTGVVVQIELSAVRYFSCLVTSQLGHIRAGTDLVVWLLDLVVWLLNNI